MSLGQIQFTIVFAAVSGFLIFTPEPLVLLRSFLLWALLTLAACYGYKYWTQSPWTQRIAAAFITGRDLQDIARSVWDEGLRIFIGRAKHNAGLIWQKCTRAISAAVDWASVLLGWTRGARAVGSHGATPGTGSSTPSTPSRTKYLAILVTTPPIHNYGPISETLYTTVDQPQAIPWASTGIDAIPSMLTSLVFRRHFALCLVDERVWRSKTMTLAEKLAGRLFWDHCGDHADNPGSRASAWSEEQISHINAIQVLGAVAAEQDATEVCTSLHIVLRRIWGEYRNIWWNDADFALALAYLVVDDIAASTCRAIMRRRAALREMEVTEARKNAWNRAGVASAGFFAGAWVLTAVTGGAALPLTGPVMVGSWGVGLGSGITRDALHMAEEKRWAARQKACARLQERFPSLKQLFA